MSWQHFLAIASAHFLALLSPGPDFFLLVQQSLSKGRTAGIRLAAGIAMANLVFIILAVAGIALIREDGILYALLYWGGCTYLAWLGWQFWRARHACLTLGEAGNAPEQTSPSFRTGLLSGLLNPKNALFYLALFTLLVPAGTSLLARGATGLWMFALVFGWDCLIVRLLTSGGLPQRFSQRLGWLHLSSALLLWGVVGTMCWHALYP
ncbi:LysE family translocator [Chitinilyticum aquatile]|uniref:LysE family translocator n=1 Tax=Chitinilyticum aquatile TaxID=362520 RepID=UPI0003FD0F86|nr:LysE family translocator [Chitinilyticum aquatile]